jgi:hypothetical protein
MSNLLLTHRRNFIVRALGFTAAGATMAVPVLAAPTPEDRIRYQLKGLEQAFQEHYPGAPIDTKFNAIPPERVTYQYAAGDPRGMSSVALALVLAGPCRIDD